MKTATPNSKKLKLVLIIIALALISIFIGQNWHPIIVNILGIQLEGRAFLVFAFLFLSGFLLGFFSGRLKKSKETPTANNLSPTTTPS
mgnify:CR=1 FL=1